MFEPQNPSMVRAADVFASLGSPSKAAWSLTGQLTSRDTVREFRVEQSPLTIGRSQEATLVIPSCTVSSLHAELECRGDQLWLVDLQSTNGTFVNGERICRPHQLHNGDLVNFAEVAFRVDQRDPAPTPAAPQRRLTIESDAADRAMAIIQLDRMLANRSVITHFQPIVEISSRRLLGYEMLARSRLFGLSTPGAMFDAAASLNVVEQLTQMLRVEGVRHAEPLPGGPLLFANTHPVETDDVAELAQSLEQLRRDAPEARLVLEIHEQAVTDLQRMRDLRVVLQSMNIELAYDDFGAGQARLVELAEAPPDYLKFDLSLIRDIDSAAPQRQRMIANLVDMVRQLEIAALAEGVETVAEHEVCLQMGFQFAQGYLYGRPEPADRWAQRDTNTMTLLGNDKR